MEALEIAKITITMAKEGKDLYLKACGWVNKLINGKKELEKEILNVDEANMDVFADNKTIILTTPKGKNNVLVWSVSFELTRRINGHYA